MAETRRAIILPPEIDETFKAECTARGIANDPPSKTWFGRYLSTEYMTPGAQARTDEETRIAIDAQGSTYVPVPTYDNKEMHTGFGLGSIGGLGIVAAIAFATTVSISMPIVAAAILGSSLIGGFIGGNIGIKKMEDRYQLAEQIKTQYDTHRSTDPQRGQQPEQQMEQQPSQSQEQTAGTDINYREDWADRTAQTNQSRNTQHTEERQTQSSEPPGEWANRTAQSTGPRQLA